MMVAVIIKWGGLVLGAIGTILAVLAFFANKRAQKTENRVRSEQCLNNAWDILGRKDGSTWIFGYKNTSEGLTKARRLIDEAILRDPQNTRAHMYLGVYWQFRRDFEKAVACHEKAIRLDEKNASAYNNLGRTVLDAGDPQKAINFFRHSLELNPSFDYARYNMAVSFFRLGRYDEARMELEALADDPYCPSGVLELLARCYRAIGMEDSASETVSRSATRKAEENDQRGSSP